MKTLLLIVSVVAFVVCLDLAVHLGTGAMILWSLVGLYGIVLLVSDKR